MKKFSDWERTIHALDLQETHDALRSSIENRKPLDHEFRVLWPDGSVHWILAKANTYYDSEGNPEKIVGVNIDVCKNTIAPDQNTDILPANPFSEPCHRHRIFSPKWLLY